ncbi:MAG: histidine--tRNA ligase [Candidatus Omnitrophota bacterium]|nr:histidine--tRNA ligase [Candidatus Omnitrophota bacterium]
MTPLKALGGTSDILPEEAQAWQQLEEKARRVFQLYGYQEIRTPLIEEAAVFTSSLGEAAEIVTKQMYLFEDRGGRSVALRPEGTASVVRALIEHGLDKTSPLNRFYYGGAMFRAERPQKGRRRQFHQIGVEVFGSASPHQDVELLCLLKRLLEEWGLSGWKLKLNSLGCREDRAKIVEHVRATLAPQAAKLCEDCRQRLEKNPLRILDCKEEGCRKLCEGIDVYEAVCAPCKEHFEQVKRGLEALAVPFDRDPHLVRGLDYYTRTAFEVVHPGLGAQDALGGGGRYDDLVKLMGGSTPVPAIGFAVGIERVLMALESAGPKPPEPAARPVYVAAVSSAEIPNALELAEQLRRAGIAAFANLEERPLGRQMKQASSMGARFALILGADEVKEKMVMVKDMQTGEQKKESLADALRKVNHNA